MVATYFDANFHCGAIPSHRLGPGARLRETTGLTFDPTITTRECQLCLWLACNRALRKCEPDGEEARWWQDWLVMLESIIADMMPEEWGLSTLDRLHEMGYIEITLAHFRQRMPAELRDRPRS